MARPYAVMVHPRGVRAVVTYEPMLTRASLEALGYAFIADHPGYYPAAERAADFDALPAVERWWWSSWPARAKEDAHA